MSGLRKEQQHTDYHDEEGQVGKDVGEKDQREVLRRKVKDLTLEKRYLT